MDAPYLLAAVSLLSSMHLGYLTRRVGFARRIHKVLPPAVTGPPEFERIFRAHQNCLEFYPMFLTTLWTCGMFFNEASAAIGGLTYIFARHMYFIGYVQSSEERLFGFYLTVMTLAAMWLLSWVGIFEGIMNKYVYVHI